MSNLNETNLLFDVASPIVTVLWDKIQKNEKCCGLQGQDDWLNSHFGKIPATCCNEGKLIYQIEQQAVILTLTHPLRRKLWMRWSLTRTQIFDAHLFENTNLSPSRFHFQ